VRVKKRLQELTRRTRSVGLETMVVSLARYLRGWRTYFGFCQTCRVLKHLDAHIRRRLRMVLRRQRRTGRNCFPELRRRGLSQFQAPVPAGSPTGLWGMSGHWALHQALPIAFFDSVGLPRLVPASRA